MMVLSRYWWEGGVCERSELSGLRAYERLANRLVERSETM